MWAIEGLRATRQGSSAFNVRLAITEPGSFKSAFVDRAFDEEAISYKNAEYQASVGVLVKMLQVTSLATFGSHPQGRRVSQASSSLSARTLSMPDVNKKNEQIAELEEWRRVSVSTDLDTVSDVRKALKAHISAELH